MPIINKLLISLRSIMGKNIFQFKHFAINQDRCAMKVGTDGTLLGAWANAPSGPCKILDIGTGTGLVALMMAQRFTEAQIIGVDIDPEAIIQAKQNVEASPFSSRVEIFEKDVVNIIDEEEFDVIVCNPPYFVDSLTCPQNQRTIARHAVTLTYESLMHSASRLLKPDGRISIVLPTENSDRAESAATFAGLFLTRVCLIKTTPNKLPKRELMEFCKHRNDDLDFSEEILETIPNQRSLWYHELTKDFYIK